MFKIVALIIIALVIFGGLMLWIPINFWTILLMIICLIILIFG